MKNPLGEIQLFRNAKEGRTSINLLGREEDGLGERTKDQPRKKKDLKKTAPLTSPLNVIVSSQGVPDPETDRQTGPLNFFFHKPTDT